MYVHLIIVWNPVDDAWGILIRQCFHAFHTFHGQR